MEKWLKAKDVADFFFKTEEDSNDDQNADSVIESSESSNSQSLLSKKNCLKMQVYHITQRMIIHTKNTE